MVLPAHRGGTETSPDLKHVAYLNPLTAAILVIIIGALTLLTWAGKVSGDATIALLSAVVGGILSTSPNGKPGVPPTQE